MAKKNVLRTFFVASVSLSLSAERKTLFLKTLAPSSLPLPIRPLKESHRTADARTKVRDGTPGYMGRDGCERDGIQHSKMNSKIPYFEGKGKSTASIFGAISNPAQWVNFIHDFCDERHPSILLLFSSSVTFDPAPCVFVSVKGKRNRRRPTRFGTYKNEIMKWPTLSFSTQFSVCCRRWGNIKSPEREKVFLASFFGGRCRHSADVDAGNPGEGGGEKR